MTVDVGIDLGGMPRFYRGSPVGAGDLNIGMRELEAQGLTCTVRRSAPLVVTPNVDRIVAFDVEDTDTRGGGMWSNLLPDRIIFRADGTYFLDGQLRFDYPSTASPYNTGQRAGKLLLNSTDVYAIDPVAGPIKSAKEGWSVDGEGVTLTLSRTIPIHAGDVLRLNYWHSAASAIECLHQNYGGTFLSATRLAGLT